MSFFFLCLLAGHRYASQPIEEGECDDSSCYIYIYIVGLVVLLRNVGYWNGSIKSNLPRIGSFDLIEPCQYHMQSHAFITIFLA